MTRYFHSVTLDHEKCRGCTNCIKRCPTEAIRVREGKARIFEERCIDCGECIRACPNHAKSALTDSLDRLCGFDFTVALPAPAFLGQFRRTSMPEKVLAALLTAGFDDVYEVAVAASVVSYAVRRYLMTRDFKKPLISSACPAIVRLIQVRFPALLNLVVPIDTPMEVAGVLAKREAVKKTGLDPARVGVFFISPCAAKVTAVKQPVGRDKSAIDGVFSMSQIYGLVVKKLKDAPSGLGLQRASSSGILWGRSGGENAEVGYGELLAVDGVHNVIAVLHEVEKGRLSDVDYLEAQACVGGCIGGPLVPENPFVARANIKAMAHMVADRPLPVAEAGMQALYDEGTLSMVKRIPPRPVMSLDEDVTMAMAKVELLEKTVESLPNLDCGSCGSPSCRALAEDIARGLAFETDCVFKLRERVRDLAAEMKELAEKVPPSMERPRATVEPDDDA
ncbi:MAG: 4Fe-4S dicluster domain-containing protein [Bacillota bacterium]|jgi:iron only hydrogenase large subunit-like protein|nr:MAG: 4Fe-4S dicluster domain-containing protein [Bacillota bacterium]